MDIIIYVIVGIIIFFLIRGLMLETDIIAGGGWTYYDPETWLAPIAVAIFWPFMIVLFCLFCLVKRIDIIFRWALKEIFRPRDNV